MQDPQDDPIFWEKPHRTYLGITAQARETLNWFIDHRAAPNLTCSVELVCWIARYVLSSPELSQEVLSHLPQSPEALSMTQMSVPGTKYRRRMEAQSRNRAMSELEFIAQNDMSLSSQSSIGPGVGGVADLDAAERGAEADADLDEDW